MFRFNVVCVFFEVGSMVFLPCVSMYLRDEHLNLTNIYGRRSKLTKCTLHSFQTLCVLSLQTSCTSCAFCFAAMRWPFKSTRLVDW